MPYTNSPAVQQVIAGRRYDELKVMHLASVFETEEASGSKAGYSPTGGVQVHLGALVRQLDRREVTQTVLTSYKPGSRRRQRQGTRAVVRRFGVPVRRWRQLWAAPAALAAAFQRPGPDLIHVHPSADVAALLIAVSIAAVRRIPLVVTLHSSALFTMRSVSPRLALLRMLGRPVEALAVRRASAIIALTEHTRDALVGYGIPPGRVHTIPQPFDSELFSVRPADPCPWIGRPRVLYVGRFSPEKGVLTLLQAVAASGAKPQLVLVGDGRQRAEIEAEIVRLDLAEQVSITGFVPHEQIAATMAGADLLVVPSLFEEAGTVLVEAMAMGLPIVASDIVGIRQTTGNGAAAVLVPPGDPDALAAAVDGVLDDPEAGAMLSSAGLLQSASRDWNSAGDDVLEIYRNAVAGEPARRD